MNRNLTEDKNFVINIKRYFLEAIEESGENIDEEVTIPTYKCRKEKKFLFVSGEAIIHYEKGKT